MLSQQRYHMKASFLKEHVHSHIGEDIPVIMHYWFTCLHSYSKALPASLSGTAFIRFY